MIGPQVLDIAHMGPTIDTLNVFGLAFLFFLAGNEVEIERVRGKPVELATGRVGGCRSWSPWGWQPFCRLRD